MSADQAGFRWSSIALPAYLPTLLYSAGEGALVPLIPRFASELGSSLAVAGFIAGLLLIGTVIGDIPGGALVARFGERNAMLGAALLTLVAMVVTIFAQSLWLLGVAVFAVGLATAVFALARHAFLTTAVPLSHRARALSTLGGVYRAGNFTGPLVAAALIPIVGDRAVVWFGCVVVMAVIGVLFVLPDLGQPPGHIARLRAEAAEHLTTGEFEVMMEQRGLLGSLWRFRFEYARVALGAGMLMALRTGRTVALPVWAVSIGMDSAQTALWIGVAALVDFALFYPSGHIMDRWGRLWGALPSMAVMSAGFVTLALSRAWAEPAAWFVAVTLVLGLANGVSSGVILTLSSDLAPRANPAPFLGGWRFTTDACGALTPVVFSAVTATVSIAAAVATIGGLGLIGIGLLGYWLPRYRPGR
ncbi:MAG TPA: MFS transporter [Microbacteriaceae bacterium]|nr:MFS transporter [Microbacteriaceae bacterium]